MIPEPIPWISAKNPHGERRLLRALRGKSFQKSTLKKFLLHAVHNKRMICTISDNTCGGAKPLPKSIQSKIHLGYLE
jgi:hypothetical protein